MKSGVSALVLVMAVSSFSGSAFAMGKKKSSEKPQPTKTALPPVQSEVKILDQERLGNNAIPREISIETLANTKVELEKNADEFAIYLDGAAQADKASDLDDLLNRDPEILQANNGAIDLRVKSSGMYSCAISTLNGVVAAVNGVCLTRVRILIPDDAQGLKVRLNGIVVIGKMNIDDLMVAVNGATFDDGKKAAVQKFLDGQEGRRVLSIGQAAEIIAKMSFDGGRIEVCKILSGHIVDPANAQEIARTFTFDQDKAKAVSLLSR
jgi:hypothetical protein